MPFPFQFALHIGPSNLDGARSRTYLAMSGVWWARSLPRMMQMKIVASKGGRPWTWRRPNSGRGLVAVDRRDADEAGDVAGTI